MNDRQKKRNSFAGKTVRLIVFLTLMIGITAGVFVFFLYYLILLQGSRIAQEIQNNIIA